MQSDAVDAQLTSSRPEDDPSIFINLAVVPELLVVDSATDPTAVSVGAAVTLTNLIATITGLLAKDRSRPHLTALARHLKLVAHHQVRNVGVVAVLWMCCGCAAAVL